MKKKISIVFIFLLLIIVVKYFTSNYEINYKIDNHKVKTVYKDKRYYIIIDDKYDFDILSKRGLSKLKIKKIIEIDDDNLKCVYPIIKNVKTNPLCYYNNIYTDYNLIDNESLNEYKTVNDDLSEGSFYFNKSLENKEYIYLWNYKGFYRMKGQELENIDLFNEGKYDNSLMYQIDNKIIFPDYNQEYEFNKIYVLNMTNSKVSYINSEFDISYNSYIVGNIKNKLYLYDQKNSNLYEVNISKLSIELVGSSELGYYKYENNKKVVVKPNEYKNREIHYEKQINSNYNYEIIDDVLYKKHNDGDLKLKVFEGKGIKIISEYENILYFIHEDKLYKYDSSSIKKLFNYFELKFNENNIIYIYQ